VGEEGSCEGLGVRREGVKREGVGSGWRIWGVGEEGGCGEWVRGGRCCMRVRRWVRWKLMYCSFLSSETGVPPLWRLCSFFPVLIPLPHGPNQTLWLQ